MKKLITVVLTSSFLISGCGGGGTSGAGGGGAVAKAGEYILSATLVMDGTQSIDSLQTLCEEGPPPEYEAVRTRTGTVMIDVTNATSLTQGLFPHGLIINSYTVAFARLGPASSGAPELDNQHYSYEFSAPNPESITIPVNIVDIGEVLPEYKRERYGPLALRPPGSLNEMELAELAVLVSHDPDNYSVTVTVRGRTWSGHGFSLSPSMVIEIGNYDTC